MKRRFLRCFALVMFLAFFVGNCVNAKADTGHSSHVVGEETVTFTNEITSEADLIALCESGGSGWLSDDIKIQSTYFEGGVEYPSFIHVKGGKTVSLCLNGHKIDLNSDRCIQIDEDAIFMLYDCTNKVYSFAPDASGLWVPVESGGTKSVFGGIITGAEDTAVRVRGLFNMYGGNIVGNVGTLGGAVMLEDKATFNILGGSIVGNKALLSGGGIYASTYDGGVSINLDGGSINENVACDEDGEACGGGVYLYNSETGYVTFNMNSGTVNANTAGFLGGGFYATSNTTININAGYINGNTAAIGGGVYSCGTVFLKDGEINGNRTLDTGSGGAGIYSSGENATVTLSGGKICSNTALGGLGGGVCSYGDTLAIEDCLISGNYVLNPDNAYGLGGAGVFALGTNFIIGGKTIITGNISGTEDNARESDLHIGNGIWDTWFTFGTGKETGKNGIKVPDDDMRIGIEAYDYPEAGYPVVVATSATEDDLDYLFTNQEGTQLLCLTGKIYLAHQHTWESDWSYDETYHWHPCVSGDIEDYSEYSDTGAAWAEHDWSDKTGICKDCQYECPGHNFSSETGCCTICGMECNHSWSEGVCEWCGEACDHSFVNGWCEICDYYCQHDWWGTGKCTLCDLECNHDGLVYGYCDYCESMVGHIEATLRQGDEIKYEADYVDLGYCDFGDREIKPGAYNLVYVLNDIVYTKMVTVSEGERFEAYITLPDSDVSSKIEISGTATGNADISGVVVGGLDEIAKDEFPEDGDKVVIKLLVEPVAADFLDAAQNAIRAKITTQQKLEIMELTLTRVYNDVPEDIGDGNEVLLTIVVPFDFSAIKSNSLQVFRYHNGTAAELTATPNADGECIIPNTANGTITIKAMKFSVYAFAYTPSGTYPPLTGANNTALCLVIALLGMALIELAFGYSPKSEKR